MSKYHRKFKHNFDLTPRDKL